MRNFIGGLSDEEFSSIVASRSRRLVVSGTRSFRDAALRFARLDAMHSEEPVACLLTGGAEGADLLAVEWADRRGIPVRIHYPDWKTHHRAAGFVRNERIVRESSELLAVWDGVSHSTKNTLEHACRFSRKHAILRF